MPTTDDNRPASAGNVKAALADVRNTMGGGSSAIL